MKISEPVLIEEIECAIKHEKDMIAEANRIMAMNSYGAGLAMGAIEAYYHVLRLIRDGVED